MTPGRPRTKPAEERRADLMDAAEGVFAERGIDAARIDEITERAGVAIGTFYLHFSSKRDIMLAVLARFVDRLVERQHAAVRSLPADDLTGRVDAWLSDAVRCVLHDLNLAAAYCDRIYVLHRGRIVADGPPAELLDLELVRTVFGVTCTHLTHPVTGGLLLAFSPRRGITPG
ncbi:TetR family transcriptional regulator [Streptomyces globisporus]|uniref:TetR family transcriptional regulator n=1 Tax=Streptomyces globisporus TaxID=1908 RepID=UPI00378C5406